VESRFARDWGGARDGWRLTREAEILHHGQKVFLPDFVLQHEDGRRVLLEIVGFWTSAYLEAKALTLRAFCDHKILVAIAESNARQVPELAVDAITYRRWLKVDQVLQRLRTIRATR
jgi:predicted nuclease of restriction endonuclease-like RecB superfamily